MINEFKLNKSLSKNIQISSVQNLYIRRKLKIRKLNPIHLENCYREFGKHLVRKDERGARDQDRSFIGLWNVSFSPLSCDLIRRACVQASAV